MARIEADREDLFQEFRAAEFKWELLLLPQQQLITCGIRKDTRLSCYFGSDPCYHFDNQNLLLRAYANGHLFRTQGTSLAQLDRSRTANETRLLRRDLTGTELEHFLNTTEKHLKQLAAAIEENSIQLLRSAPAGMDLVLLQTRLKELLAAPIMLAPPYRTRRR